MKHAITLNGKPLQLSHLTYSQVAPTHYTFGANGWLCLYKKDGTKWFMWRNAMEEWVPSPWLDTDIAVSEIPRSISESLINDSNWLLEIYTLLRGAEKSAA